MFMKCHNAMHCYEQLYMLLNMKTQRKYLRGSQLQTFILCGDFRLEMLAFFTSCLQACCWFTVFFQHFLPNFQFRLGIFPLIYLPLQRKMIPNDMSKVHYQNFKQKAVSGCGGALL